MGQKGCPYYTPLVFLLVCCDIVRSSSPDGIISLFPDQAAKTLFHHENNNEDSTDDCESCKLVVKSFLAGMDKTMRGKHEGGDTSWEERNLKNYADSEIRLVEIQEELCNDISKDRDKCFSVAEEAEQLIEDWWFKDRKDNVRLHDHVCIKGLKKCCPEQAFGPSCRPCPSDCNGHGVCDGAGTRSGTGECICQQGYTGENCEQCKLDYYNVQTFNGNGPSGMNRFTCMPCHDACSGGCSGPSTVNCTDCKPGYERDPATMHCNDINECELDSYGFTVQSKRLCSDGTYCLNTEGHYKCADCHRACSTCLAYGRDKCITCASDHFMDENHNCVYTTDYDRHDPKMRENENYLEYLWRRFHHDIVLKIILNLLLFTGVQRVVDRVNRGSLSLRLTITFFVSFIIQMKVYPIVQKLIVTNFGKNPQDSLANDDLDNNHALDEL